jgi:hypothetical protein
VAQAVERLLCEHEALSSQNKKIMQKKKKKLLNDERL